MIMLMVFMLSVLVTSAGFAKEKLEAANSKITFEAKEITDQKELIKRAKKGVIEGPTVPIQKAKLTKDGKDFTEKNVKTFVTVQKLKEKEYINKEGKKIITTTYKQDVISFVSLVDESEGGVMSEIGTLGLEDPNESYDDDGPDKTAKVRNTIYYNTISVGIETAYNFTKITSKWDKLDSSITWDNSYIGWNKHGTWYNSSGVKVGQGTLGNQEMVPSSGIPSIGVTYTLYTYSDEYVVPSTTSFSMYGQSMIKLYRGGLSVGL
ncbi:MAG: hypothetical protein ACOWWO_12385 [Peptococcaceae bacterium]